MNKLSNETAQLISSAQVITCASNAVKELVENALDAGATSIDVKLEDFGLEKIEVKDNGAGMVATEMKFAAQRHYTSKITTHADLQCLQTYGFRGEALSSLCEIGNVTIITRTKDEHFSTTYTLDLHGCVTTKKPSHLPQGTTVIVSNLFKNLPVRKQYFKSTARKKEQLKFAEEFVMGFYLAKFSVRLSLFHDKCLVWRAPKSTSLKSALVNVLGAKTMAHFTEKEISNAFINLCVFMSTVPVLRKSSDRTFVIINKRPVRNKNIDKVLKSFCKKSLERRDSNGKSSATGWPTLLLKIEVPLNSIDANVNPNKTQVMLTTEDEVLMLLEQLLTQEPTKNQSEVSNTTADSVKDNISTMSKESASANDATEIDKNSVVENPLLPDLDSGNITNSIFYPDKEISKLNDNSDQYELTKDHTLIEQNDQQCLNNNSRKDSLVTNDSTTKLDEDLSNINSQNTENETNFSLLGDNDLIFSSTLKQPLVPNNSPDVNVNQSLGISNIDNLFDKDDTISENTKIDIEIVSTQEKNSDILSKEFNGDKNVTSWSRGDQFTTPELSQNSLQPVRMCTGVNGGNLFQGNTVSRKRNSDEMSSLKQTTLDNSLFIEPNSKNPRSDFGELSRINKETTPGKSNSRLQIFNSAKKSQKSEILNSKKNRSKHRRSFAIEKFLPQNNENNTNAELSDEDNIEIPKTKLKFCFSDLKSKVKEFISSNYEKDNNCHFIGKAKVIGRLEEYNSMVIQSNNELLIPNLFRMQEKIIYENLLSRHKLKPVELDANIEITEQNIGIHAFDVLHNLPGAPLNDVSHDEIVSDVRISSNGFEVIRVKQSENSVLGYKVCALCCTVPYYGLLDLKEILETIENNSNVQLNNCRPIKVQFYLQSESARVCKSMQPHQIIEDFSENLNLIKSFGIDFGNIKCFHEKEIFHKMVYKQLF